ISSSSLLSLSLLSNQNSTAENNSEKFAAIIFCSCSYCRIVISVIAVVFASSSIGVS
ncbi:hypothetical protein SDJN02_06931, partial [Cucurbita argyrosperma subsp. argyrosperma]